jgi:ABC-2 type transport system permease protein
VKAMLDLIRINLKKQIWELKNNRFRVLLSLALYALILYMFYYNSIMRDGDAFLGLDYQSAVVVFVVFWLIISSFAQTGSTIVHEAKIGTLEQLIITPYGLRNMLLSRLLMQLGTVVISSTLLFAISGFITGVGFSISVGFTLLFQQQYAKYF